MENGLNVCKILLFKVKQLVLYLNPILVSRSFQCLRKPECSKEIECLFELKLQFSDHKDAKVISTSLRNFGCHKISVADRVVFSALDFRRYKARIN